ncbi:hypothetical protein IAE22_25460 [Bacillus sp. S34]|nr:hypothetical protein [Bacillus sp. S34]
MNNCTTLNGHFEYVPKLIWQETFDVSAGENYSLTVNAGTKAQLNNVFWECNKLDALSVSLIKFRHPNVDSWDMEFFNNSPTKDTITVTVYTTELRYEGDICIDPQGI